MGNVYTMRLKHMTEDKWNARAEGRREQRTHQPTGGRGAQGGLRMGEMERDAVIGHGIASFVHESYMKRADGTEFTICNGCGTVPIYNDKIGLCVCPMCDGPLQYVGTNATNLELLPPVKRSLTSFSKVEMPYATKLLEQELSTYMNMSRRILTNNDLQKFESPTLHEMTDAEQSAALSAPIPTRVLPETQVPEFVALTEEQVANLEDLSALSALPPPPAPPAAPVEEPPEEGPAELEEVWSQPQQQAQPQQPYIVIPMNSTQAQVFPQQQGQVFPQQQAQQQAQQQTALVAPLGTPPPANILPPPMPGAPSMIAVDTSNSALRAQGLPDQQQPIRSALRSRTNTTRRVGFAQQPQQQQQQQQGAVPTNTRVNVIKTG